MPDNFVHHRRILLADTDPAGVVYFARYYILAHEAFELFLAQAGLGFDRLFHEQDFILPVVHSRCDYRRSLVLGEEARIALRVAEIRRRKFVIDYDIQNEAGKAAAVVRTEHMAVDQKTGRAIPLPAALRTILSPD